MGSKVRLRRGFHAGRLRGEASPRNRLGNICGVASDPYCRWLSTRRPYLGGCDIWIAVRFYHRTHYTQVILIYSQGRMNNSKFNWTHQCTLVYIRPLYTDVISRVINCSIYILSNSTIKY